VPGQVQAQEQAPAAATQALPPVMQGLWAVVVVVLFVVGLVGLLEWVVVVAVVLAHQALRQ
jgi:hypothetical protein